MVSLISSVSSIDLSISSLISLVSPSALSSVGISVSVSGASSFSASALASSSTFLVSVSSTTSSVSSGIIHNAPDSEVSSPHNISNVSTCVSSGKS
jgi:hypothetical protein